MFDTELDFFIKNQDDLVKRYKDKILAIKEEEVVGVYKNPLDAYLDIERKGELGNVMIQPCQEGSNAYTVSIATIGLG